MILTLCTLIATARKAVPNFAIVYFDCPAKEVKRIQFSPILYAQSSDGKRSAVVGIANDSSQSWQYNLPELAWEGSLHTFICSDATQKRTWFIEKGADGRYQARKASHFFLPSRETADGRARASWPKVDGYAPIDLKWKLTLALDGKRQVFTVRSFNKLSAAHPTSGNIVWSCWSPSRRYFAVCMDGLRPGRKYSSDNEHLAYVIDATNGHIRLMGHGFRGCWLSDQVFSRTSYTWEDREDYGNFPRISVVEDLKDSTKRSVFPKIEFLGATEDPNVALALVPQSAHTESVGLANVNLLTPSKKDYFASLNLNFIGDETGVSNFIAVEKSHFQ